MTKCIQCPHVVGDIYQRDCAFPDCIGWRIDRNPKPIPDGSHVYKFVHDDHNGENGGNCLSGTAISFDDACRQIADIEAVKLKNNAEVNRRMECIVMQLVDLGVNVTLNLDCDGRIATFESGFYKSDGQAKLKQIGEKVYLLTRYGQKDEITDVLDVVEVSMDWHKKSKGRYHGWINPAQDWAALYDLLSD